MPYIGTPAVDRFTSTKAASVFSGDGSTTAFTLDHAVGSDEDILVSVDGVIQEPSVAYAVSNGTTLTFTAARSSNSGNNIFVYYLFRTVGTVGHPSNQNLSAGTGTFTGDVTIGDASAADKKILFDGNAQDFHIGLDDSSDSLTIGLGSALGTTSHMVIDSTGAITKPLQPAFYAHNNGSDNITNLTTGSAQDVPFSTELFDINGDFSSNTFTAPVDGYYTLGVSLRLQHIDSAANYYVVTINTSNRSHHFLFDPDYGQDNVYHSVRFTALADMDAGDTAKVQLNQNAGTAQTEVQGDQSYTYFFGSLTQ